MNRVVKSCCVAAFFVLLLFSDGSDASDLEIDVASAPADVLELVDFTIIDGTATLLDATGNPYSGISFTRSKEFFDDTPFLPWELFNSGLKKIIVPGKSLTVDVGRGRSYIFGDSSSASEGEKVFIGTFDSPMENISIHSDYYINNSGGLVTTQSARNGRSIFLNAENIELSVGYKTPAPFKSENRCVLGSGKKSYGGEIVLNASKSLTIDGDICNNYNPYEDSGRINPDAPILYSNAHSITLNAGEQNADSDVRVKGDMYCAGVYYQGTIYNGNSINAYFRTADSLFRGKAYTCSDRGDPDATGMIPGGCDPTKNEGVNLVFSRGARWEMTDSSSVSNLSLTSGASIDMGYEADAASSARSLKVLGNFSGDNGSVRMRISGSTLDGVENDCLYIGGKHSGVHKLNLNLADGVDPESLVLSALVYVEDEEGVFEAENVESSLKWHRLFLKRQRSDEAPYDEEWVIDKVEAISDNPEPTPDPVPDPDALRPTTSVLAARATGVINYHFARAGNDRLTLRMGELRSGETSGVWARVRGAEFSRDDVANFDVRSHSLEIGRDTILSCGGAAKRYLGMSAAFSDGDTDYNGTDFDMARGNGDNSGFSAACYFTELGDDGSYRDFVLRGGRIAHDFTLRDSTGKPICGKTSNAFVSCSGEAGHRYDLQNGWFAEPSVQLTYLFLNGDDYRMSNGVRGLQGDINSLVARGGVAFGRVFNGGYISAHMNIFSEFLGDWSQSLSCAAESMSVNESFRDTWMEYGIGTTWNFSSSLSAHFDIMRGARSGYDEEYRWSAGLRCQL